jgi:hypothetical protein
MTRSTVARPALTDQPRRAAKARARQSSEIYTMKTWHWYDPPVLFPIFLLLLIVGFALLRTAE